MPVEGRNLANPISVIELNNLVKQGLETIFPYPLRIKGEVSSLKLYPTGHIYFTLKDKEASVSAVIWKDNASRLSFIPVEGDEVVVSARVSIYPTRGQYQINVISMEQAGLGDSLAALKALYEKLQKEGLFDIHVERKLPAFPKKIGVIAGKDSAGMKDVTYNIAHRWPLTEVIAFPSLVQGKGAPVDLIKNFHLAIAEDIEVLIIGRGGGAKEDLSAFNDEALVRELATCPVPLISAVGHEIDTTLTDYVADYRVSTPTAAAIKATPDKNEVRQNIDRYDDSLSMCLTNLIINLRQRLEALAERPFFIDPKSIYSRRREDLILLNNRLYQAENKQLVNSKNSVSLLKGRLDALSPSKTLDRGYSFLADKDGHIIKSISQVKEGEEVTTTLSDGKLTSKVINKEEK